MEIFSYHMCRDSSKVNDKAIRVFCILQLYNILTTHPSLYYELCNVLKPKMSYQRGVCYKMYMNATLRVLCGAYIDIIIILQSYRCIICIYYTYHINYFTSLVTNCTHVSMLPLYI